MGKQLTSYSTKLIDGLWDLWCIGSLIGIWPRFIEPNLLSTTELSLTIPQLPSDLNGLRILQFSDLHWHAAISPSFLHKLTEKINDLNPDIIVFTGDFLCYGVLPDSETLQDFLGTFHAPYGCYAILGNHDYQNYVSVGDSGDYEIAQPTVSPVRKGWGRMLSPPKISGKMAAEVQQVSLHRELIDCLRETPFKLLHNENYVISINESGLNLVGLGEHMLGRCFPEEAFKTYDSRYPSIVLLHNPDGLPKLKGFPGDMILCGHTHGGQVNLPLLCNKFLQQENRQWKRGLYTVDGKQVYVNRGVNAVMPFRWFSVPELLLLTLKRAL